jgi:hypothetical protein
VKRFSTTAGLAGVITALMASTASWQAAGSGAIALAEAHAVVGCQTAVNGCDDTLVKVTTPGTLNLKTTGTASPATPLGSAPDVDVHLYQSDASGKKGDEIGEGGVTFGPNETIAEGVDTGFYVVEIHFTMTAPVLPVKVDALLEPESPEPAAQPVAQAAAPQQESAPAPQQSQPEPQPAAQSQPAAQPQPAPAPVAKTAPSKAKKSSCKGKKGKALKTCKKKAAKKKSSKRR